MRKKWKVAVLAVLFVVGSVVASFAEGLETLGNAFTAGKISGSVGNYMEYVDKQAADSNYGWGTAYVDLKYKTAEWNRLSAGIGFFAHGSVYNESDNAAIDPFNVDIEKEVTLPELYLSSGLMETSSITLGRFDHRKISHIDDNQSEGAYLAFNEVKDLGINVGVIRRFAEIDYDDGEDFGRNTKAQDLDSKDVFGSKSDAYLVFIDGKYKMLEQLTLNPYMMYQNGYASVYGMDADVKLKAGDVVYGSNMYYYYVNSKQTTSKDATVYALAPYIKVGPVDASVGFANFDEGTAFNRPTWLADNILPLDQISGYGLKGAEVYFGKLKYTIGKFWTHVAAGVYNQDYAAATGDGIKEYETQFGYNLTKALSLNLRLFDVNYDHVSDKDYQKVETHVCYKF